MAFNLFLAAKKNQSQEIRNNSSLAKSQINLIDRESGKSALHYASESGNLETVKVLLELGADPNILNSNNASTPLHAAAYYGHSKVIAALIGGGAKPNVTNNNGITPLHSACDNGHLESVLALLKGGANCEQNRDKKGATPLHYASAQGNVEIVEALLKHGVPVDLKDDSKQTPLLWAGKSGNLNTTGKILTQYGADVNMKDCEGLSLTMEAKFRKMLGGFLKTASDPTSSNLVQGRSSWMDPSTYTNQPQQSQTPSVPAPSSTNDNEKSTPHSNVPVFQDIDSSQPVNIPQDIPDGPVFDESSPFSKLTFSTSSSPSPPPSSPTTPNISSTSTDLFPSVPTYTRPIHRSVSKESFPSTPTSSAREGSKLTIAPTGNVVSTVVNQNPGLPRTESDFGALFDHKIRVGVDFLQPHQPSVRPPDLGVESPDEIDRGEVRKKKPAIESAKQTVSNVKSKFKKEKKEKEKEKEKEKKEKEKEKEKEPSLADSKKDKKDKKDRPPPSELKISKNIIMKEGQPIKEGYLWIKRGKLRKSWNIHWFVLEKSQLTFFSDPKKSKPIKSIQLDRTSFVVQDEKEDTVFYLQTSRKKYAFEAEAEEIASSWIGNINASIMALNETLDAKQINQELDSLSKQLKGEKSREKELEEMDALTEKYATSLNQAMDAFTSNK